MGLQDEKVLQAFLAEIHQAFEYWAEVRIKEIEEQGLHIQIEPAESKALEELVATKTGRNALKKLLIDCGVWNLYSTLGYIDGRTGLKPLELVDASTHKPIAEDLLHRHLLDYCSEKEQQNK